MFKRKFVHLLFTLLLSFSFLFISVFAEETSDDYGISVLSLTDENHLGYVGWINTGYNEWDSVISFIDSLGLENYEYVIRSDSQGDIDILYEFDKWSSNTTAYFKRKGTCVASGNTSYSCSTAVQSNYHNFTQAPLFAMNVVQPDYYADVVNWNAVSFEQAKVYYQNSDSSQASTQDILDAIVDGTDSSSDSADVADSANSDLKDVIDEYDSLEQSYIQDFNTNLDNIDVGGFSWDSSFLTSAAWVTSQFNTLVMETPFESLITFSLIIGITLYLIGRYKG